MATSATHTDTLAASLMLAELTTKVTTALQRIDLSHPGLDKSQGTKVRIMQAMLEDVEHRARDMARELLSACSMPSLEETRTE